MAKKKPPPAKAATKPIGAAKSATPPAASDDELDPDEPAGASDADAPAVLSSASSSSASPSSASSSGASPSSASSSSASSSGTSPSRASSSSASSSGATSSSASPSGASPSGASPSSASGSDGAAPGAAASATSVESGARSRHLPTGRIPVTGNGPVRTTQTLQHGATAWGARFVKRGFATTEAGDLAFALGFPHLEYIFDGHPDDARAEMIAYERRSYRLGWPRHVATRWARTTASKGFKRTPQGASELDPAGKKAIKNPAPLSAEEIMLSLKAIFSDTTSYEDLRDLVRLFEAFVGPELVASSIVDALEKSGNNVWNHQDQDRALVMHHLGFVLLRLPPAITDKLRGRLEAVFDRRVKALANKELLPRKGERGSLLRALDLVLHGRAGAERSGERNEDAIEPADLVHVTDDEAFVREAACRVVSPDARLVFLGGEPVLDHLLETFSRLRGTHHVLVDGFAEVASPKAIELLQRVAKGKEAPDRARAVLAARGV